MVHQKEAKEKPAVVINHAPGLPTEERIRQLIWYFLEANCKEERIVVTNMLRQEMRKFEIQTLRSA